MTTMAVWIDVYGHRYIAPAGGYTPGQFTDTGSRLVRLIRPEARK